MQFSVPSVVQVARPAEEQAQQCREAVVVLMHNLEGVRHKQICSCFYSLYYTANTPIKSAEKICRYFIEKIMMKVEESMLVGCI